MLFAGPKVSILHWCHCMSELSMILLVKRQKNLTEQVVLIFFSGICFAYPQKLEVELCDIIDTTQYCDNQLSIELL